MERTKKEEKKPMLWRKLGGGSLRLPGRIIKPNQQFRAYPEEIPVGFRDLVQPLEGQIFPQPEAPEVEKLSKKAKEEPTYAKRATGQGWWEIYRTDTGKVVSEKKVRESEADDLLEQLNLEEA